MKTKLVYVLTCSPEGHYIEMALMSVWSARHWNPDAHIVLITDDLTDKLFVGKRAEILDYISEKIVVPFEDDNLSMMFRSRWIKTSVRQLIQGDFLFIDVDTIICKHLCEIDNFDCKIGSVGDGNIPLAFNIYRENVIKNVAQIGCDISDEEYYFSSGVLYVKDILETDLFYASWHKNWLESSKIFSIHIDQPALAKTNIEHNHLIQLIPDIYNNILYSHNSSLPQSYIFHICGYGPYIFFESTLTYIKNNGLTDWIKDAILNIHSTYLPSDYLIKYSSFSQKCKWIASIANAMKVYIENMSKNAEQWHLKTRLARLIHWLFSHRFFYTGACIYMMWKSFQVKGKTNIKENVVSK